MHTYKQHVYTCMHIYTPAQSAGVIEYTDNISAEG